MVFWEYSVFCGPHCPFLTNVSNSAVFLLNPSLRVTLNLLDMRWTVTSTIFSINANSSSFSLNIWSRRMEARWAFIPCCPVQVFMVNRAVWNVTCTEMERVFLCISFKTKLNNFGLGHLQQMEYFMKNRIEREGVSRATYNIFCQVN